MSDFNIQCPKCKQKVVWRFFFPKTRADYCCQTCGNCWKEPLDEVGGQYGTFVGPWQGQEMTKLEENLSAVGPDTDWNFFKGKRIYTAWQECAPQHLITSRTVDELTYWVALSTQDTQGTWYETYRRLADGSLHTLDLPHS